jgi:hypothetical protein
MHTYLYLILLLYLSCIDIPYATVLSFIEFWNSILHAEVDGCFGNNNNIYW